MGRFRTYLHMVIDAIESFKDRNGTSNYAIKNYIIAHENVTFEQHYLRAALKKGVDSGILIKVKSSYKLADKVRRLNPRTRTTDRPRPAEGIWNTLELSSNN